MKELKTRKAYLSALHAALIWRLPPQEAVEVWEDYDGFFADGLAEGKTEADLCAQFGPPREVARAVQEESPRGVKISRQAVLTLILLLAAVLLWLFYCSDYFLWKSRYWAGLFSVCIVPALCIIWRGRGLLIPPLGWREAGGLILLHGLALGLWLAPLAFYFFLLNAIEHRAILILQKSITVGTIYGTALDICRLLILTVLLVSLFLAWRRSARFLTVAAHGQAVLVSLTSINQILHSMDVGGPADLEGLMVPPILMYAIELLSVLAAALLLWREWRCFHRGRTA